MIRSFIKFGLINICCITNITAMLLVVNNWFEIKPVIIKSIILILIGLSGVLALILSTLPLKYDVHTKMLDIVYVISFVVFGICVLSSILKVSLLNLERGSILYGIYSRPAILPVISGVVLFVLKK